MYEIYDLKCNNINEPRGIGQRSIEFSWKLSSSELGSKQDFYKIQVFNEEGKCVWNSKKVKSTNVFGIKYEGEKLESHNRYKWKVTSYSNKNEEVVSRKASFSMGMLENNWQGKWIEADMERKSGEECTEMWKIFAGMVRSAENPQEFLNPSIYMRKEFKAKGKIKKAIVYATARGIYQLKINGTVVSEPFAPGYTSYLNHLEVQQYDVTKYMTEECETIGVILADGWFTGKIGLVGIGNQYGDNNAFYMQMEVFYEDGSRDTIVSDESFKWNTGNYEYADLFVGERYHQGKINNSWQYSNYDMSDWKEVSIKTYGTSNFKGINTEPVSVLRRQKPSEIIITPKGELVIDAGENIVGYLKVKMYGKPGMEVKLTHSEVLDDKGNFLMNIMGQNKNQMDVYIFEEEGEVVYEPVFTFHGFRYVKVEGITEEDLKDIEVCVLGTDLQITGKFECSDSRINQLQANILRSQQGNMLSIPTDCPQRERAGWTGDMQVYSPTACFNMDMLSFLDKWLINMRYEQLSDGQIPNIIPLMDSDKYMRNNDSEHICSAAWGDACIIIPHVLYHKYGNKKILLDNYEMIEKWMKYVEKQASTSFIKPVEEYTKEELECQKYLWNTEFHFGDWLYPSASGNGVGNPVNSAVTSKEYVASAMFAYTSKLMSEICEVLGKKENKKYYQKLHENICKAYAKTYIDEEGKLPVNIQGLYVLALQMGLYPEEKKAMGINHLVQLIHENDDCLDTGFASIGFLLDVLYENGYKDLAYKLLFQTKCPSWLYEVEMGATTIWESWSAITPDGYRTNSSYNHFSFGCVGDFIYRRIGGLYEEEVGYKRVRIEPDINCGLSEAKLSYNSVYGMIKIVWKTLNDKVYLDIELPVNVTGVLKIKNIEQEISSGKFHMEI